MVQMLRVGVWCLPVLGYMALWNSVWSVSWGSGALRHEGMG